MKRTSRHDAVALARQQNLSALLILSNLFVGGMLAGIVILSDWSLGITSGETITCIAVFAVSWLNLLIATDFLEWLRRLFRSMPSGGPHDDGEGIWRFAFYNGIHRQDPVLLAPSVPPAPGDGEFPCGLKERFERLARAMERDAKWDDLGPDWPERCEASFTMKLAAQERARSTDPPIPR